jgi:signal transduction histidine kinase
MNQSLQNILQLVDQLDALSAEQKKVIIDWLKEADKAMAVTEFKLDRTEKVKRTTAILLEETIQELELKRKAVEETNEALQNSLEVLKAAQQQLIQAEKMASLGELTAGIAHEIQNPLNFVNNFSEVSNELLDEMQDELDKGNLEDVKAIASDIRQNLEKILHHGQRADGIVKSMLQHSRSSTGQKEPTNLNVLADEYLRLAYHGLRAANKSFSAKYEMLPDPALPAVAVVPQDMGRVLLNLINNAFYAAFEKGKTAGPGFVPSVAVSTRKLDHTVELVVRDNGSGIPAALLEKIFQPFFTTKPTGKGTGLGLSLSYDIVKAHGGALKVESREGEGTSFIIVLPA